MRAPLVARCEPPGVQNRQPSVLYVFAHKTKNIRIHAPHTPVVAFWYISNIPPMMVDLPTHTCIFRPQRVKMVHGECSLYCFLTNVPWSAFWSYCIYTCLIWFSALTSFTICGMIKNCLQFICLSLLSVLFHRANGEINLYNDRDKQSLSTIYHYPVGKRQGFSMEYLVSKIVFLFGFCEWASSRYMEAFM